MSLGRSVKCDGCGAEVTVAAKPSARPIPAGWRRIAVRSPGTNIPPRTFDICSAMCGARCIDMTYEAE